MGYRKPKKVVKKFKKQKEYHSDSEDEETTSFNPVNMDDSDDDLEDLHATGHNSAPLGVRGVKAAENAKKTELKRAAFEKESELKRAAQEEKSKSKSAAVADAAPSEPHVKPVAKPAPKLKSALKMTKKPDPPSESEDEEEDNDDGDEDDDDDDVEDLDALDDQDLDSSDLEDDEIDLSDDENGQPKKTRKRNDPTAFATSMSKILGTKLTTTKRQDPVLSRSAAATAASKELAEQKLEAKARRKLHAEKREALEKGRVKDVLGLNTPQVSTAEIQETEKRLQKTAQRGVVKLFNAVRAAQVKGEQARSEAKKEGVVGISQREERVSEMSKKGFLDLIAGGGKKPAVAQEA